MSDNIIVVENKIVEILTIGEQGPEGIPGLQGPEGSQGIPGIGLPTGGTAGQILKKQTDDDYDANWENQSGKKNVWIPAIMFSVRPSWGVTTWTNGLGGQGRYSGWKFIKAQAYSWVNLFWQVPYDWKTGPLTFNLYFTGSPTSYAGRPTIGFLYSEYRHPSFANLNNITQEVDTMVQGVISPPNDTLTKHTHEATSYTPSAAGVFMRISVYRRGTHPDDTNTGDTYFVGMSVEYD